MGEVRRRLKRCVWGEVWGSVLGCGGGEGSALGCGKVWREDPNTPYISPHLHTTTHFPHFSHTSSHTPNTSPRLPPHFSIPHHISHLSPTVPHSFHIPFILDPTPQTTENCPILPLSILFHTPTISPHTPPTPTPPRTPPQLLYHLSHTKISYFFHLLPHCH